MKFSLSLFYFAFVSNPISFRLKYNSFESYILLKIENDESKLKRENYCTGKVGFL